MERRHPCRQDAGAPKTLSERLYQLRAGLIDTETGERLTFTNPETGEQTSSIPLDTFFVWQPERVATDTVTKPTPAPTVTTTTAPVSVGTVDEFPPGSVSHVNLETIFVDPDHLRTCVKR